MQNNLDFENVTVEPLQPNWLPNGISLSILRLDKIHPVVSGNKWFKLKHYLQEAKQYSYTTIATFGGAYSNHILATAFAAGQFGFESIGIIRGEEPARPSQTLQQAAIYGMQLKYVSRQLFDDKESIKGQYGEVYWLNEGGYGIPGARGAGEIMGLVNNGIKHSHIVCAVGTGTMFAGIVGNAKQGQKVIGVSVLRNNFSIHDEVAALLSEEPVAEFDILHGYDFGGYAKHPKTLLDFMAVTWNESNLPTDIVYTAKTLHAIKNLVQDGSIPQGSNVLMIHSGGLQGNNSLQNGVLPF